MHLTGDICGARVEARREDREVVIRVGDETCSPAEIDSLSVPHADLTGTTSVGGFVFDSTALAALKQFAAAATLAAQAELCSQPA